MLDSTSMNLDPYPNPDNAVLELYYNNLPIIISPEQTPYPIGRDISDAGLSATGPSVAALSATGPSATGPSAAGLSVTGEFASRHHCAIEFHDGKFVLKDFSRNGTFVQLTHSQIFRLKNEATPLTGGGCFKLGATIMVDDPERILFRVKSSRPNDIKPVTPSRPIRAKKK